MWAISLTLACAVMVPTMVTISLLVLVRYAGKDQKNNAVKESVAKAKKDAAAKELEAEKKINGRQSHPSR